MQKVFEASGYQFTIVTPNDGEPHFIGREIADALGYSKPSNLSQHLQSKKFKTLVLNKYNGLPSLKNKLGSISKRASQLTLIPSSSLQEYLLRHSKLPKAKEIGKILYELLSNANPVFDQEVLDDWGTSLEELTLTVPQLFDTSKKVNGFILGLVTNLDLSNTSRFWISFLVLFRKKSVQIRFSKKRRFYQFTPSSCSS